VASRPWEDRLREQGFRITPQRQLVLESVNRVGHGTPEEILVSVQETASGVNLSTIYRTLEVLESVSLITHTHIGHGAPVYHSQDESPHIHLVCDRCAEVTSVPAAAAAEFSLDLQETYGFDAHMTHMAVTGVCTKCSEDSRTETQ
jgi:Fur family transcriptional regulator, ferric uptake regulator